MALIPSFGRLRVLRTWGGIVDMSMDGSPIIDRTAVDGLYLNGGWCYGGLQGDAGLGLVLRPSHRHATSRIPSRPPTGSTASRRGALIDEKGAGAQPNLH